MSGENQIVPDVEFLLKMARTRMPFGKYKDQRLIDLPEVYILWFNRKGYPAGQLGDMLKSLYEIKLNGLDYLLNPLRRS